MTDAQQVIGIFRDRGQAELAIAAARREGFDAHASEPLVEEADGLHVRIRVPSTAEVEGARRLLLDYGAYRATIS